MNILPKKRWHVRTKQNIERVRRDEAKATEEEKELKRRIQLAEQEARTELLRKKAKTSGKEEERVVTSYDDSETTESIYNSKDGHVNFFKEIEENGGYAGGTNKEHEAEEKAKKEKFEKDIGLLTYLGQSSVEAKGEVPWYLKSNTRELIEDNEKDDEEKSKKHKAYIDPLNTMNKYLDIKKKNSKDIFEAKVNKDKTTNSNKSSLDTSMGVNSIEALRAKRLKREAEERRRSQEFLKNLRGENTESKQEVIYDDRLRKYNSQFNPHLAKNSALDRSKQRPY